MAGLSLNGSTLLSADFNALTPDGYLDVNGPTADLTVVNERLFLALGRIDEESEVFPTIRALNFALIEHRKIPRF